MENKYFNEETHEYFIDDKKFPSVTDIVSPISFERMDAINKVVLENARRRGTEVHELCETLLLIGEIDEDAIPNSYLPYIYAFEYWLKTYKPKVLFTEHKLFSATLGYCGTVDLICEIDNEVILLDIKATSVIDYKSVSVQLAGYMNLLKAERPNLNISKTYVLHLKKAQDFTFKEVEPDYEWFDILKRHNIKMNSKKEK